MDDTTRQIADFAAKLRFEDLPADVVHGAKQRLIDTVACGMGARECEAVEIALRISGGAVPGSYPGRVLASSARTTAESAAFINSCMARYLDFNDTYPGGHPSDGLGALLAVADHPAVTPQRLITGLVVLYEVFTRTAKASKFRELGWDQGFNTAVGIVAGIGNMLGLDAEKIAHGVSIAVVSNNHLRATRAGNLSLWKGAACGFAARNGAYTALLAAEGMTGPEAPIEGRHGLREQIAKNFTLLPFPTEGGDYLTNMVRLKFWPVEYNAQIGVWAALELRQKMPVEEIKSVDIGTYWSAWHEIGSEPEKWDPKNRETADHSLPYIFAKTLLDGTISVASFDEDQINDAALRPLMSKITVRQDESIEARFPAAVAILVTATDGQGKTVTVDMESPRGHEKNPMTDAEISEKFTAQTTPVLGAEKARAALDALWNIDRAPSAAGVLDLLVP